MSQEFNPSDARLQVHRRVRSLLLEVLAEDAPLTPQDEDLATELGAEVLDVLGLEVLELDGDGSMLVRLRLEAD